MRPTKILVQPVRGRGRNAVRQAIPRRRKGIALPMKLDAPSYSSSSMQTSGWQERIRHLHASSRENKAPPSSYMQTNFHAEPAQTYAPDPAYILSEWKLLERKTLRQQQERGKGKERALDDYFHLDDVVAPSEAHSAPPHPKDIDPTFFTSGYTTKHSEGETSIAQTKSSATEVPARSASASLLSSAVSLERRKESPLWTATVDEQLMRRVVLDAMTMIRSGSRDINAVAVLALNEIESISKDRIALKSDREARLEELRMLLLSFWLQILSRSTDKMDTSQSAMGMLIEVTRSLYSSTVENADIEGRSTSMRLIQRSTLHRLFGMIFEWTYFRRSDIPAVRNAALRLCSVIVRDKRLRGSQARYMTRKLLSTLHYTIGKGDLSPCRSSVWTELADSIETLLDCGVLVAPRPSSPLDTYNHLSDYVELCGNSVRKYGRLGSPTVPFLVAIARKVTSTSRTDDVSKNGEAAFVRSKEELESLIDKLAKVKDLRAARILFFLAPRSQRTFRSTCLLMKRWSNTPLDLTIVSDDVSQPGKFELSRLLLREAVNGLDWNDSDHLRWQLQTMAVARFTAHADACNARDVIRDLDILARFWPAKKIRSRVETLGELGAWAQIQAVRALARSGRIGTAKRWALIFSRLSVQKAKEGEPMIVGARLLNIILHALFSVQRKRLHVKEYSTSRASAFRIPRGVYRSTSRHYTDRLTSRAHLRDGIRLVARFHTHSGVRHDEDTCMLLVRQLARCRRQIMSNERKSTLIKEIQWASIATTDVIEDVVATATQKDSQFTANDAQTGASAQMRRRKAIHDALGTPTPRRRKHI